MKPVVRRLIMIFADAAVLMFGYYVSYYLIGFIGRECTDIFVSSAYIFAALKLAVFAAFFMYSLNPDRSFLLDVAGIVVANAAAVALAVFIFKLEPLNDILVISIVLAWDLVIVLMVRFLFRNPDEYEDDEYDDDYYLSPPDNNEFDGEEENSLNTGALLPQNENDIYPAESEDISDLGKNHVTEAASEIFAATNVTELDAEINRKLDSMIKMIEEKDSKIEQLENKLALQASMDFENFAPEEDNVDFDDYKEETEDIVQEDNFDEDAFYGYTQPLNQTYNQYQPQQPKNMNMYNNNIPYSNGNSNDNNKKEIIDSILTDIKELYATLTAKTKELDEREKNMLMRMLEVEQREKALDRLESQARAAANEVKNQASMPAKRMRDLSDELMLPKDNIQLADNILKALDDIKKRSSPPFVLAEAPKGENNISKEDELIKIEAAVRIAEAERDAKKAELAKLETENKRAEAERKKQQQQQAKMMAEKKAKEKAEREKAAQVAAKKKAAEDKQKKQEELARRQNEKLKNAITPKPKAPVEEKNNFDELDNDNLNLNLDDLDSISSFLDNL